MKALIKSHADGDDACFYAVAMQVAARSGHGRFAVELRGLVDKAKEGAPGVGGKKPAPNSIGEFKKRMGKLALEEDEQRPGRHDDARAGSTEFRALARLLALRGRGSLNADIWTGVAADLADRGAVGVSRSPGGGRTSRSATAVPSGRRTPSPSAS